MTQQTINSPLTLVTLIAGRQQSLQLEDQAIADALGCDAAVIRMIKAGRTRLPINKVSALASVLDVEAGEMMRLLLSEIDPVMLESIENCVGPLGLSPGEKRLLTTLRNSAKGRDVAPIFFEGAPIVAVIVG